MSIHRFLPQSLKTRVTLLTLLAVIVSFMVLAFYSKTLLREELMLNTGEQQRSALNLLSSEVNNDLRDRLANLEAVALRVSRRMMPRYRHICASSRFWPGRSMVASASGVRKGSCWPKCSICRMDRPGQCCRHRSWHGSCRIGRR
jgi:hypothetical protein